ncbi:MAG: hypothetical protein QXF75_00215 [Candidatus Bathyarchaeia archaeon]
MEERVIIVDVDETLFKSRLICRFLRKVAQILFKLSLNLQKPNKELINKLRHYDRVVILTARGVNYWNLTERQFRKHHVCYNEIIMCNYSKMIYNWKKSIVERIHPDAWIDDIKSFGVEGYV